MTSSAIEAPIEVICISDDELDDCLIISPNSHPISAIETNGSDNNKGHHHDLQGIIEQKSVTRSFDVYISSIDGKSQLYDIVSSQSLMTTDLNTNVSPPNFSSKIASPQGISRNHQSDFESSVEDLEKENRETPRPRNSRRKIVSPEECDTCSPPFHTCKRFGNVTGNFTPHWKNVKQYKLTEMKPIQIYRCKVCSKAFTQKWILVRHQLIHEDTITWNSCPFCTHKTPYPTSMKLHLKNHKARCNTRKTNILKTERKHSKKVRKVKRSPFWQCVYCQKKFHMAEYCERHELRCRGGDRVKLSKVITYRLRRGLRESMPNK